MEIDSNLSLSLCVCVFGDTTIVREKHNNKYSMSTNYLIHIKTPRNENHPNHTLNQSILFRITYIEIKCFKIRNHYINMSMSQTNRTIMKIKMHTAILIRKGN